MENEVVETESTVEETHEVNPIAGILSAAGIEAEDEDVEPVQTVEEEPVEEVSDNPTTVVEPEFYTIEELTELGKSESLDKINTAKIPPELQAVYKSLNAMATRRQQSLAEKEKELTERLQQQQPTTPLTVEHKLYTDPVGAMRDIQAQLQHTNRAIHEAQAKDDIFEVQKLMVEKDTLKDKYMAVQGVIQGANSEWDTIYKAIPDFQEKAPKLKGFTAEVLGENGFTEAELSWLTNPLITGKISSKIVRLVSNMYDLKTKYEGDLKATKEKLVKAKPTPSLSPGSGDVVKLKNDVKSIRAKAMASSDPDDIAAYIAAITKKE